jgi:hypothetical protein
VYADGTIAFEFTKLESADIPAAVKQRYTARWVDESCFAGNRKADPSPEPAYCKEPPAKAP